MKLPHLELDKTHKWVYILYCGELADKLEGFSSIRKCGFLDSLEMTGLGGILLLGAG